MRFGLYSPEVPVLFLRDVRIDADSVATISAE